MTLDTRDGGDVGVGGLDVVGEVFEPLTVKLLASHGVERRHVLLLEQQAMVAALDFFPLLRREVGVVDGAVLHRAHLRVDHSVAAPKQVVKPVLAARRRGADYEADLVRERRTRDIPRFLVWDKGSFVNPEYVKSSTHQLIGPFGSLELNE